MNDTLNIKDPAVVNRAGINALIRELGAVGTINFIQQFDRGYGNYTEERNTYYDNMTVDDIAKNIMKK